MDKHPAKRERLPNSAGGLQSGGPSRSQPILDSPESHLASPALDRKGNPYYNYHHDKATQQEESRYWATRLNAVATAANVDAPTGPAQPAVTSPEPSPSSVHGVPFRLSRSERNSSTSLYFGEPSLQKAHSMSLAERMSERTGTAVTSEAAAKFSKVDNKAQCKLFSNDYSAILKFSSTGDAELGQELKSIFMTLEKCLGLRKAYMTKSLQMAGDNPKDLEEWELYRTCHVHLSLV